MKIMSFVGSKGLGNPHKDIGWAGLWNRLVHPLQILSAKTAEFPSFHLCHFHALSFECHRTYDTLKSFPARKRGRAGFFLHYVIERSKVSFQDEFQLTSSDFAPLLRATERKREHPFHNLYCRFRGSLDRFCLELRTTRTNHVSDALFHLFVQYLAAFRQFARYYGASEKRLKPRSVAPKFQKGIDEPINQRAQR